MKKNNYSQDIFDLDEELAEQKENDEAQSERIKTTFFDEYTRHKINHHVVKTVLILMILYVCFLLLGALSTEYYEDSESKIHIIVADIDTLEDRNDYDAMKEYIEDIRDILVDITALDARIANGELNYGQAVVNYKSILNDKVDRLIPKIESLKVETRNEYIRQNCQVILANDIAFYLQYMSNGLQQQDESSINNAVLWKSSMMQTYSNIMQGMNDLAIALHREDDRFLEWDLEDEVANEIGTDGQKNIINTEGDAINE